MFELLEMVVKLNDVVNPLDAAAEQLEIRYAHKKKRCRTVDVLLQVFEKIENAHRFLLIIFTYKQCLDRKIFPNSI